MTNDKFNTIERPRLLMSAAKEFVKRQQFFGKTRPKMGDRELQQLIEIEAKLENERLKKGDQYTIDRHIKILADLIGQAQWHVHSAH